MLERLSLFHSFIRAMKLLGDMNRQDTAIRHLQFMNLRPFQDSFNQI